MQSRVITTMLLGTLALGLSAGSARAEDKPEDKAEPSFFYRLFHKPDQGDFVPATKCDSPICYWLFHKRYPGHQPKGWGGGEHTFERAGYSNEVSKRAQPTNTCAYVGYYVGGGCPYGHFGEPRYPLDGTWGWDWTGWCFHRKVDLLWWHGRRYQGGTGAYKTDGPRPLERLHQAGDGGQ